RPSSSAARITAAHVIAFTAYATRGNTAAVARIRSRRSASSITTNGVPNRSARSAAARPPTSRPAEVQRADRGQGSGIVAVHALGRRHAEHREEVREYLLGRATEPQTRLRQLRVIADHAALGVETVE